LYEAADLVFVGKSLPGPGEGGGHNLLEPAAHEKPILFGPRMGNFREAASLVLAAGGGRQVADARELEAAVVELLGDPGRRLEMGRRAESVLRPHQGAALRSAARLLRLLEAARARP
jgi:3-deoxy-D-manno-octulosonic-acid transferase